jgi:Ser/Thr protein kinase RdoA (MazF antagonist)
MLAALNNLAAFAHQRWPIITGKPELVMHRENTVYCVQTSHGPAALRLHREGYHSQSALQSELDWMAMLAQGGIKVPTPLATRDGHYLVKLFSPNDFARNADLLTWLDGAPLGHSNEMLCHDDAMLSSIFKNVGATLAHVHNLSDAWKRPKSFSRPNWDAEGLVGEQPFWGRFWTISDVSAEEADILTRIRDLARSKLAAYVSQGADYGLIHADLVRENILIAENEVCFIDFDDSGFGFRMFDIATTLIKNQHEPAYELIKQSLFAGYESQRPISAGDKATLPLFLVLRSLTYLGWAEARRGEPGMGSRKQRMVKDAITLSRAYLSAQVG